MQTLPYPYRPSTENIGKRTDALGLMFVIGVHLLLLLAILWTANKPPIPVPQAMAPKVMEASLIIAAPPQPPTELAPGPQQVEATSAPKPLPQTEQTQKLLTSKEATTTISDAPKKPEPVQEKILEEPEETVVTEQQTTASPAPATTAPTSTPAPPAETATAPSTGVNQQKLDEIQINWQQQIQLHLERWKRYPRAAQMRNQEGMPWVKFSMDRNGSVLSVELVQSSGVDSLDKEAIALVKRAEPLPTPPIEVEGETITLTVPIEFFINR